jgi:hypothetical protein
MGCICTSVGEERNEGRIFVQELVGRQKRERLRNI